MKKGYLLAAGLAGLFCLTGCTSSVSTEQSSSAAAPESAAAENSASDAVYEDTQEFMGTYIMVRAYGEHAQDGVEAAFARAKELEQVFSNTIADSEVNQVNTAAKAAVGTDILISADMANVLRAALEYGEKSGAEAYIPSSHTYIEKDSSVNDEIDKLRHSATAALFDPEQFYPLSQFCF